MIRSQDIAQLFSALSHPSRVDILLAVLPHAEEGMTMGALAAQTEIAPSTLAHHVREMEQGSVLMRRQEGRSTMVTLNVAVLASLSDTLNELCCSARPANKD